MWVYKQWERVNVCTHWPYVCVFWVIHSNTFLCAMWMDSDIVHRVSRALEYAGCLCCPSACSAFLALSYNGALEHCDVIKPVKLLQLEFQLSGIDSHPGVGHMAQDTSLKNTSEDWAQHPNRGDDWFRTTYDHFHFSQLWTEYTEP